MCNFMNAFLFGWMQFLFEFHLFWTTYDDFIDDNIYSNLFFFGSMNHVLPMV
jgi:hypothetical protein